MHWFAYCFRALNSHLNPTILETFKYYHCFYLARELFVGFLVTCHCGILPSRPSLLITDALGAFTEHVDRKARDQQFIGMAARPLVQFVTLRAGKNRPSLTRT